MSVHCRQDERSEFGRRGVLAVDDIEERVEPVDLADQALQSRAKAVIAWLRQVFVKSWVLELAVVIALAVAYNVIRAIPHGSAADPFRHANDILSVEGPVFDFLERPLNEWINTVPIIAVLACYYYAVLHYAATPIVFFMSRRRGGWQYWRGYWALIIASGIALAIYAMYPAAPPRLMSGLGIVDIMREYAGYGWWGSAASAPRGIGDATNQFAAMPSMHFGWSLWCAIQMWKFGTKTSRTLALLYPTVLAFVVLATGNHFLLDILGGAACVIVGYGVVELIGRRLNVRRESAETPSAGHQRQSAETASKPGAAHVGAPAGQRNDRS